MTESERYDLEMAYINLEVCEAGLLPLPAEVGSLPDAEAVDLLRDAFRVGSAVLSLNFYKVIEDEELVSGAIAVLGRQDRILTRMRDELNGGGRLSFLSAERLECLRFALLCLTADLEQKVSQWKQSRFDDARRGTVLRWLRRKISLLSGLADFADRLEVYHGGTAKCE